MRLRLLLVRLQSLVLIRKDRGENGRSTAGASVRMCVCVRVRPSKCVRIHPQIANVRLEEKSGANLP